MKPANGGRPGAVLFDLDGTLADSLPDLAGALNELFMEKGWATFAPEDVKGMIGGGIPKLVERALARRGLEAGADELGALVARYRALYAPRAARETRLFPGAKALLERLHGSGVPLGVVTNKPEAVSREILEALGVLSLFGAVIGGDTLTAMKPDAAPVLAAVERLGCAPQHAVMIGDSAADAGAARAAGVAVLLVAFGYTRTPVRGIDADGVVESFDEAIKSLKSIGFPV